ncbi:phytoene desaturase family protein [Agromyces silvae]|uniref:phytoene desaturase family protein n=1 Tax=Agromyces silvae TaxID=3388266 RepID=UPI00280C01A9|nr:NAD(P)/FAD-dependent oxidoreductase [Agromyces protaetiae]
MSREAYDAIVVGAGPNGLAAAVTLARAGLAVRVYERNETPGGGARTSELTLPGFTHDVCSAVHPLAFASHFFREFGLTRRVEFVVPELSFAHPLDGGRAALAWRDLERTAEGLGRDGAAYRSLMQPLVTHLRGVADFTGSALLRVPADPITALRFGLRALEQGSPAWDARFEEDLAPALLTGVAAHTILPLPSLAAAGAGLSLATYAHTVGWPIPRGGSQAIITALVDDLVAHGGELITGHEVTSIDELPPARAVLLDVTPRALAELAGSRLPGRYVAALDRFRYGNGVAKVDFALSGPVPWRDRELATAGTVHVGGTRAEIAAAENAVTRGMHPEAPYVLVSQPSVFDPGRAPAGQQSLWTYTHVPRGSNIDRAEAVTAQIERFAPGFRDTILATASSTAVEVEAHNPNYVLGDISSGEPDVWQLLKRPVISRDPWRTPARGVYLCGASAAPGPGVHGLGGWYAALSALKHEFGTRIRPDLSPREPRS